MTDNNSPVNNNILNTEAPGVGTVPMAQDPLVAEAQKIQLKTNAPKEVSIELSLAEKEAKILNKKAQVTFNNIDKEKYMESFEGNSAALLTDNKRPDISIEEKKAFISRGYDRTWEDTVADAKYTGVDVVKDTGISVAKGVVSLAQLPAIAATIASGGKVGLDTVNFLNEQREKLGQAQSEKLQLNFQRIHEKTNREYIQNQAKQVLDGTEDSVVQEVADFLDEFGTALYETGKSPLAILDVLAENVPSILTGGYIAKKALNASAKKHITKQGIKNVDKAEVAKFFASDIGKETQKKITALYGSAVGGLEEGGALAAESVGTVLNMTYADLRKNSPLFRELTAGGLSDEEARKKVAVSTGSYTFVAGTLLAGAVSKITGAGQLEGSLFVNKTGKLESLSKVGSATTREAAEEGLQGVVGQGAANTITKNIADESKEVREGLAEESAIGTLAGGASGTLISGMPELAEAKDTVSKNVKEKVETVVKKAGVQKAIKTGDVSKVTDEASPTYDAKEATVALMAQKPDTEVTENREEYVAELLKHQNTAVDQVIEKLSDESITDAEKKAAFEELNFLESVGNQIEGLNKLEAKESIEEAKKLIAQVQKTTPEDVAKIKGRILKSSHSFDDKDIPELEKIVESDVFTKEEKKVLKDRIQILKTMSEVSFEVAHGDVSKGSLGISNYQERISNALAKGDTEKATKSLGMLNKFAERHAIKAKELSTGYTLHNKLKAMETGSPNYIATQQQVKDIAEKYPSLEGKPFEFRYGKKAKELINVIQKEAVLLKKAVKNSSDEMGISSQVEPVETPTTPETVEQEAVEEVVAQAETDDTQTDVPTETNETTTAPETYTQEIEEAENKKRISRLVNKTVAKVFGEIGGKKRKPVMYQIKRALIKKIENEPTLINDLEAFENLVAKAYGSYLTGIEDGEKGSLENFAAKLSKAEINYRSDSSLIMEGKPINVSTDLVDVMRVANTGKKSLLIENENLLTDYEDVIVQERYTDTLSTEEHTHGRNVLKFVREFSDKFSKIFDPSAKKPNYYSEAPVHYLVDDSTGSLPENAVTAIATTASAWLATKASDTVHNDEDKIKKLLNLSEWESIPDEAKFTMSVVGDLRSNLISSLGKDILKTLNITARKEIEQGYLGEKLENHLGQLAIATLIDMDLLEDVAINNTLLNEWRTGDDATNSEAETHFVSIKKQGKPIELPNGKIIKVAEVRPDVKERIDELKPALPTMEKMFGVEVEDASIITEVSQIPEPNMQVQGSFQKLSKEEGEILDTHNKRPVGVKKVWNTVEKLGKETMYLISGYNPNYEEETQSNLKDGVKGENEQALRSIDAMFSFKEELGDIGKTFYFLHEKWVNGRLGMKRTKGISLQGDKNHRHVFGYTDQRVTINPTTDKKAMTGFLLAVAQGLDIDIDKKRNTAAINELFKFIQDPTVKEALEILSDTSKEQEFSVEQKETIVAAVAKGKLKTHSLDSLYALATYLKHPNKPFKTDLFIEMDGITNGVMISLLQLGTTQKIERRADPEKEGTTLEKIQGMLNAGGIFSGDFSTFAEYKETGNKDSYEQVAEVWEKEANEFIKTISPQQQVQAEALMSLIGTIERKLAKDPLMVSIYGANLKNIIKVFTRNGFKSMYSQIQEAYLSGDNPEKYDYINLNLNLLLGTEGISYIDDGNALTFTFNKYQERAISDLINKVYGESLGTALSALYGDIETSRNHVNKMLRVVFEGFKIKYDNAISDAESKKKKIFGGKAQLSREERKEITLSLLDHMPIVKSFFSTDNSEGMLVMKKDKKKLYDPNAGGVISGSLGKAIPVTKISKEDGKIVTSRKDTEGNPLTTKSMNSYVTIDDWIDGGVSGAVINIHGIDAATMFLILKNSGALNVHDAIATAITEAEGSTLNVNEDFLHVIEEHSIMQEIQKTLARTSALLTEDEKEAAYDNSFGDFEDRPAPTLDDYVAGTKKIADAITEGKKEVIKNLTHVGQYYLESAVLEVEQEIEEGIDRVKKSSKDDVSTSSFNAKYSASINADNSVQIFDDLGLPTVGGARDSKEHTGHLKNMLDSIVNKVVKPVTLKMQDVTGTTAGVYVEATNNIYMNISKDKPYVTNGLEMSAQEVYVHELLHSVLTSGIDSTTKWASRELRRLYEKASEELKVEHFLEGAVSWASATQAQKDNATEVYNKTFDYIFRNEDGTGMHEFAVYGLSNERFKKALQRVDGNTVKENDGTLFGKLVQLLQSAIDKLFGSIHRTNNLSADAKLHSLALELIDIDKSKKGLVSKTLDKVDDVYGKAMSGLTSAILKPTKQFLESDSAVDSRFQTVRNVSSIAKAIPNVRFDMFMDSIDTVMNNLNVASDGFLRTTFNEFKGRTPNTNYMHRLLRKGKTLIDKVRADTTRQSIEFLNNSFSELLDADTKKGILKAGIKTDLSFLIDLQDSNGNLKYTETDLVALLTDDAELNRRIQRVIQDIGHHFPTNKHWYINMSKNLGRYMAKGTTIENDLILNTKIIADLDDTDLTPEGDLTKARDLIDELATLSAMKDTEKVYKQSLANVWKKELNSTQANTGVATTLQFHKRFKEDSLSKIFDGNEKLMGKGYTKEILNPRKSFVVANLENEKELLALGYVKGEEIIKDNVDPSKDKYPMYFFYSEDHLIQPYLAGAYSLTGLSAKGSDLAANYGQTMDMNIDPYIQSMVDIAQVNKAKRKLRGAIATNSSRQKPVGSVLVPVYNNKGQVAQYRYMMDEKKKDEFLEKNNNFDMVLGTMQASVTDKVNSELQNRKVTEELYKDYLDNYAKEPSKFVAVGLGVANKEMRERYMLLSSNAREHVRNVWGSDRMYIRAEAVPLLFGQRKLSMADLTKRDLTGEVGFKKLKGQVNNMASYVLNRHGVRVAEDYWKDVVSLAKDRIVIASGVVMLGNIISNFVLLKLLGVPIKNIFADQAEGLTAAKQYQKDYDELAKLTNELELRPTGGMNSKINARIADLKDALERNPVHELIQEGVYQSIIEDVEFVDDTYSGKSKIAKLLEPGTDKVPEGFKKAFTELALTKESVVYKFMRDTTQLSDFVGRYALHKHNLKKGMDRGESIDMIMDVFINYDLPTHKYLQYGNDMGITMFTKYFIRIQRVLAHITGNYPQNVVGFAFGEYVLDTGLGVDVSDPFEANAITTGYGHRLNLNPVDVGSNAFLNPYFDNLDKIGID